MSTHTVVYRHQMLTPQQALLTDQVGNEVYSSHYAERKAYRFVLACGTVVLLGSLGMNLALVRRPVTNRYIRIDEMKKDAPTMPAEARSHQRFSALKLAGILTSAAVVAASSLSGKLSKSAS